MSPKGFSVYITTWRCLPISYVGNLNRLQSYLDILCKSLKLAWMYSGLSSQSLFLPLFFLKYLPNFSLLFSSLKKTKVLIICSLIYFLTVIQITVLLLSTLVELTLNQYLCNTNLAYISTLLPVNKYYTWPALSAS